MNRVLAQKKAQELVAKMTVEEAASQLKFDSPAIERLGIPAYNWWNETLHGVARAGVATVFPQAIGMAATFDPELLELVADVCSTEGRAKYNASSQNEDRDIYKGLTFWSPNVNIFRDPRWGRGHETYGEDPVLTSSMGDAFVRGLQGDGETLKVAACAKHFAVHSGPEELRHEFNAEVSEKDLFETYLFAFETLVKESGVEAVMGAYNRTNGEVCCASKKLMDILRNKWQFKGHFLSDCWAVRDFHERHHVTSRPEESCALAINMGCDLNCGCTYQYVMNAFNEGLISEAKIRESAVRLFTTRYLLGLFDKSEFDSLSMIDVSTEENVKLSYKAATESLVLLKNDGILPLNRKLLHTVAVIGPNADSRSALIGNYHGTASKYVTVLEGIREALEPSVRVLYSEGCHLFKDRIEPLACEDDRISEAVSVASLADVVFLVVGLDETLEGEEGDTGNSYKSGDKENLLLPLSQRKLIDAVLKTGKKVITILMAGSSIDLQNGNDGSNAILLSWYPGQEGGHAVSDVLFGQISPSGKLPVTFYHNSDLDKMPSFEDYSMKNRTYRYFREKPLYQFGYGLTYGDCKVLSFNAVEEKDSVRVSVLYKNFGKFRTQDVIQIYAQNKNADAPDNPRLVGFLRIDCGKNRKGKAEVIVPKRNLYLYDKNGNCYLDKDVYLYCSFGQPENTSEALQLQLQLD